MRTIKVAITSLLIFVTLPIWAQSSSADAKKGLEKMGYLVTPTQAVVAKPISESEYNVFSSFTPTQQQPMPPSSSSRPQVNQESLRALEQEIREQQQNSFYAKWQREQATPSFDALFGDDLNAIKLYRYDATPNNNTTPKTRSYKQQQYDVNAQRIQAKVNAIYSLRNRLWYGVCAGSHTQLEDLNTITIQLSSFTAVLDQNAYDYSQNNIYQYIMDALNTYEAAMRSVGIASYK